jgi:CheY-like chemotaxis protein
MAKQDATDASSHRVLLVEDEMLVAMLLEDMLTELGHEIAGVAAGLEDAMSLARNAAFDLAILDVHLGGRDVFPVAEILIQRRIPFAFATGYGVKGLPEAFRSRPTLQKPFQIADLKRVLGAIAADSSA